MYPSIYYAVKDLFGLNLPFLKMIQSFGFFVAIAFLVASYFWTKELKRKEEEGILKPEKIKVLKGAKATNSELIVSAIFGFFIGYKLVFIALNFSEFLENTQGYILSSEGNLMGAILGAGIAAYSKFREHDKNKLDKPIWVEEIMHPHQHVGNMSLIAAFFGIIGAKIFHNLENWDEFMSDPVGALLSFSGLTMYGGLIVAATALIIYGKKNKIPATHLVDSSAPSLMIGYAIGRIGCHVSGDGDWGIDNIAPKPDWLSWAPDWVWSYDYPHNVNSVGERIINCFGDRYCYHLMPSVFPTPFYETIMCALLFVLIWGIRKQIKAPGVLFSIYLMLNGVERFFIEKIRVNTLYNVNGFEFTQAELISTILFFLGLIGIFYFHKREKERLEALL